MCCKRAGGGKGYGLGLKVSKDGKAEEKVTQFISADNCSLVSSSGKELRDVMMEAAVELRRRRRLEGKKEEMAC